MKPFALRKHELTIESGCILWGTRVVVPLRLQDKLLSQLHSDHLGIMKMKIIARSYIWWPGLDLIEQLANSCEDCQASGGSRTSKREDPQAKKCARSAREIRATPTLMSARPLFCA